ncbi:MAG: murein L,D-transpeptidase catalytic domain family protein [Bacteriovorax sp.]|nr:murein L,D-transpeptidase catalytic domain family protein [Bacteriovorax sp.]
MRQSQNTGLVSVFFNSRLFFVTALLSLGINGQAYASGAKLPDIATAQTAETMTPSVDTVTPVPTITSVPTVTTVPTVTATPTVADASNSSGSVPSTTPRTNTGIVTPIADKYAHLDPGHEVPSTLLSQALSYYDSHQSAFANKRVISVIDFKQHSSKERFYIIDMETGRVDSYLVAAGKNSDPDHDGYATSFSNTPGSEMSSIGFYKTAETYEGGHGYSLMLDGLSNTNSNVRSRSIVIHPADYVSSGGRSWGCPALEPRYSVQIIDQIKGGSLIYASNVY